MTDNNAALSNQPQGNTNVVTTTTSDNLFGEYSTQAGLGTKYKSTEDLAKGKVHADNYIEQLKADLAEKERLLALSDAKLAASANSQQVLEEIKQLRAAKELPGSVNSEVDINTLIEQQIDRRTKDQVASANKAQAEAELKAKFGTETKEVLEATAREFGVSPAFLIDVSATSPKAFLKYFDGVQPATPPAGSAGGSINTIALSKTTITDPLAKVKAETEALGINRRKDPKAYFAAIESSIKK